MFVLLLQKEPKFQDKMYIIINNKCYIKTNIVKARKFYEAGRSVWFYNEKDLTIVRNAGFLGSFDFETRVLDYKLNNETLIFLIRCGNGKKFWLTNKTRSATKVLQKGGESKRN